MKYELYNSDCLEKLKDIADKSVDLVLTDPPYILGNTGGGFLGKTLKNIVCNITAKKRHLMLWKK